MTVKIKQVQKRTGAIVDFNPDRITNAIYRAAVAVGGRDRETAEGLAKQVVDLLGENATRGYIPTVEEIQDAVEKVLIENGHARVAKAYILYRDERERRRREQVRHSYRPSDNIPWAKIWHVLEWAVEHGVHTIESLNERIERGEFAEIVRDSELEYEENVKNAVEIIAQRRDSLKMVTITGPSSSGKTTTTIKVGEQLARFGLKLVTLNVDNYFFDLEMHPKDEFGDYDFETPQALELSLVNKHLVQLFAGEEVLIPTYDFKKGKRTEETTPMKLSAGEILLIDSLHGLYPPMTEGVPEEQKFKLYLEPLLQMKDKDGHYVRWTNLRLIRRMLRDRSHRAYDPRQTLTHWHYVRSSEMRNIIPYIHNTDYIINSGMPYELSLYRPKLLADFAQWERDYKDDPLREDAYMRAARVRKVLEQVTGVDDDSPVPETSVLREFIGGSAYKY